MEWGNSKCKECLGCNRLEVPEFKGILRCENFVKRKEKEDEKI